MNNYQRLNQEAVYKILNLSGLTETQVINRELARRDLQLQLIFVNRQ